MECEVEGPRPKRTWRQVVKEDCQARKVNTEDAMDRSKWRKLIKDVRWLGWVWVSECFFWYRPTRVVPDQRPINGCVRVCVCQCFNTLVGRQEEHLACRKLSDEVLVWFIIIIIKGIYIAQVRKGHKCARATNVLSVWSEVQIVCIWSSWCHCIPKPYHLNPDWFYLSGKGFPGYPGKEAIKQVNY